MTQPELDPTAAYGTTAFVPPPNPALAASAQLGDYQALYRRSLDDPDAFWRETAQAIMWHQPFAQVLGDRSPSRNRSPSCPSYPKRARARSCAGCLKRKPWVNRWVTPHDRGGERGLVGKVERSKLLVALSVSAMLALE
jgi:hypothetical protein